MPISTLPPRNRTGLPMKIFTACAACVLVLTMAPARQARAHGTPIIVGADGAKLAVSGGIADQSGIASPVFFEINSDGDAIDLEDPLPIIGRIHYWDVPGFEISGLESHSNLSLEVLSRPLSCCPAAEESLDRVLWYWNPLDGVRPAASKLYLLGTGLRTQTLAPDDTTSLPPFLIVDQVGGTAAQGGQQGFHNHDLLAYALDNNSPPAAGAYGFFARLTSNEYLASDPFLIVLNFGVEYASMSGAALAINAAAANSLQGDFNRDCIVDAADYIVWRKTLGTADEYQVWRANFGASITGAGGPSSSPMRSGNLSANVPEPTSLLVAACVAINSLINRNMPRRSNYQPLSISDRPHISANCAVCAPTFAKLAATMPAT
jgi:hypothetical protein